MIGIVETREPVGDNLGSGFGSGLSSLLIGKLFGCSRLCLRGGDSDS
jgi:hypothetical protein